MDSEAPARLLRVASLWDFAGNVWFSGSEAVLEMLRSASLEGFAGNVWFLGSEAVVAGMRKASLVEILLEKGGFGDTAAGIYFLRLLQIKRCGRLGQRAVLALACCPKQTFIIGSLLCTDVCDQ